MEDSHSLDSESIIFESNTLTLEEQNEQLRKEIALLKSQFEDAINMTINMDKINTENAKLNRTIIDLKSEKEEIERRMEIIIKSKADLSETLENQKKQYTARIQNENATIQNEKNKVAQGYQQQMDLLYNEISEEKKQNQEIKLAQKVAINQIQKIIDSAGLYFQKTFLNSDDLISFFQTEHLTIPSVPNPNENPQNENQIIKAVATEYENTIKNLKKKIKARTNACKSAVEEITRMRTCYKSEVEKYQFQADQLQQQINERENNINATINELNLTISKLKTELNSSRQQYGKLKNEFNEYKLARRNSPSFISKTEFIEQRDEVRQHEVNKLNQEKLELRNELEETKTKLEDLTIQFTNLQSKAKDTEEKLRQFRSKESESLIQIRKYECEINSLKGSAKNAKAENESLRKQLNCKVGKIEKGRDDKKQLIEQKNKIIEKKDDEISKFLIEIKQKQIRIDEQVQLNDELKYQIANLENDLAKQKSIYNEYVIKKEGIKIPTADDIIPPTAFKCSYFDPELASTIMKIASNPALQPTSKIDRSFKAIQMFYLNQIKKIEDQYRCQLAEQIQSNNKINQFLIDLSISINDQKPITLDEFIRSNANEFSQQIVKSITDFKNNNILLTRDRDQYYAILQNISQIIGVINHNEIPQSINNLKNDLLSTQLSLHKMTKKHRSANSESKNIIKKLKLDNQQYQQTISDQQSVISSLETKLDDAKSQIHQLSTENNKLQSKLKMQTKEVDLNNSSDIIITPNVDVNAIKAEFGQEIDKYIKINQKQKNEIDQLNNTIQILQSEIANLKQFNSSYSKENNQLTQENATLKQEMIELEEKLKQQSEKEKNNLQKSFDQTINEIQQRNEQDRSDMQKFIKAANTKEEKIKELNLIIHKLTLEKGKLAKESNNIKEEYNREKMLNEATTKTKIVEIESKCKEQIDQMKHENETEKRNLVLYAANAFRMIIPPSSNMALTLQTDQIKSYKILIDKVKDLLTHLNESDQTIRKMLNVYANQTTQDAVAQLLYNAD